MANNGIYYSSGNTLNFTTDNTTWATLTSGGTFIINTVSGGTYLNLTGGTTSGAYLPLSGGTMTGGIVANSGLTANTISQTSYIDFTTGSTNPSSVAGRLFFDATQKSLSYFDITNNQVPIAIGQQLYTRVWNATGVQIDKGKVITITGTSNNLPSVILAVNNHALGSPRPIGVSAENIPNGSEGLVLNNGILSGITLNTFANGDILYLSDTIPGEYVSSTSSLAFSARTNEIGYVLQTGTTTGKIYVNINNEDSNLTLTDKERNILEGNVISSGAYEFTGITQGTGSTINVSLLRGWIVKNTYQYAILPDVINLYYSGGTNIPLTNLATADSTYLLINSASTLVQQITFPTPQERRENIYIGRIGHVTRNSITNLQNAVDFDVSPISAIRDLWTPLKLINGGVLVSANGVNMNINTSEGVLWGNGIGWSTNQLNPDSVSISGTSPTTFQYRTRLGTITGGTVPSGNTTTIYPGYYDLNGVVTAVGGGSNSSTNQRVYLFPTGLVRIQLGQQVYGNLAAAVAGSQTEQFTEFSNNRDNGILIGILSVNKNASVGNGGLVNTSYAVFNFVSKFGEVLGGTGGLSTTTLQQAYDNSSEPEILINSTLDGVSIQNGTGNADNVTQLLQGKNTAGTTTSFIRADGAFSGTSIYATTISATTYQNLPQSVSGTGTQDYVTKWDPSGSGIIDSTIYDDGSFVGINITSPTYNESVSIQTGNKGVLIDDAYIIQTGNNSLAFASRYDYTSWGGSSEIAIGTRGPLSNSTGSGNIGIGDKALLQNITGNNNIGIGGTEALGNNIGGNSNIGIGNESLIINSEGSQNIAIGESSLRNNTSGSTNIAIGTSAGYNNLNDNGNIYIGDSSGYNNTGGNNIFIGYGSGSGDTSSNNRLNIGETIFGSLSGKTIGINVSSQTNTLHVSASTNPVRFEGLQSSTDTRYLVSDGNGVVTYRNLPGSSASDCFGTFYTSAISGCSPVTILTPLNATEGLNVTGTTIIQSLSATSFSASTYQGNVVSQITAGSGISVDQSTGNVTITATGGGGTFTGGTVTGSTNFTGGLSSNTISATTYQNLPTTNQYIVVAGTGSPMVPSSGQLILNPSEGEVFEMYISKTTYNGINNSSVLEGIKNGTLIFNNSLYYSIYSLNLISDNPTYVRFQSYLTGGSDYFSTGGQIVGVTFISFGTVNTLTTVGTSGAATLVGSTLNIPQYGGGGGGGLTFQQVQMVAFLSS